MIQLKDVIRYYLGCDVKVTPYGGQPNRFEYGKLTGINVYDLAVVKLYKWQSATDISIELVKPILRRLEDISKGEAIEVTRLIIKKEDFTSVSAYRHRYTKDLMVRWGWFDEPNDPDPSNCYNVTGETSWTSDQFVNLLGKGVDLFDLIESGQAIDAKTLTNGQIPTSRP